LCTYLPTYYLLTYPPPLTYLLIIYTMLMSSIVWYTKYEGIALNALIIVLIIFDHVMSINGNLECGYCTLDQLLWLAHRYCIFWYLLLKSKIVENPITKYNTHIWNNVISNIIHLNNYYIFCDQNVGNFFLKFFFLVLNYFLLLLITISLFLLIIYIPSSSFFSLSMHILCPTFGYCTNHPKKPIDILCFKCGYCKIILTKLMFILWPLCKYFRLNFMFLKFF